MNVFIKTLECLKNVTEFSLVLNIGMFKTNENLTNVMGDIWNLLREGKLRITKENRSKSPFLITFFNLYVPLIVKYDYKYVILYKHV